MKFIYQGIKKAKRQLATSELFKKVALYLHEHQGVTLRELKSEFDQDELLSVIEVAVDQGLILRNNRRYQLNFPIYEKACLAEIQASSIFLKNEKIFFDLDKNKQLLNAYLLMKQQYTVDFIGVPNDFKEISLAEAGNQVISFVNISSESRLPLSLARFFSSSGQMQQMEQKMLTNLIGDVNPEYFFDQVMVILERSENEKKIRNSIFLESLIKTQIIMEESGTFKLCVPQIERDTPTNPLIVTSLIECQLLLNKKFNGNKCDFIIKNNYEK